jgi:DNA repair protein RecO (recombination protein O)
MNQLNTRGIILVRTDFGEADRIITLLTPDQGKLRLMAKGVRRIKSKLAGGIELFSVSDITFIRGRGEIGTLVSSRLQKHFGTIIKDINRTMVGYELIKQLHKATEDEPEPAYFDLLEQAFASLDDAAIDLDLISFWFTAQLLRLAGHAPNLKTDTTGKKLESDQTYHFDFEHMAFRPHDSGQFGSDEIKFLRLAFAGNPPQILQKVQGSEKLVADNTQLVIGMKNNLLRT